MLRRVDGLVERLARQAGIETKEGHHFHARGLGSSSTVIDLGANVGKFAHPLAARFACRVYAIEASPALCAGIPAAPTLRAFNLAVGGTSGPVRFYLSQNPEANSVSPAMAGAWSAASPAEIQVQGITLADLFQSLGTRRADLLKVDVEGAEIALFDAAPDDLLREIGQITVEFHDFMVEANVGGDVRRIVKRLTGLGFIALVFSVAGSHDDVLFLNDRKADLTFSEKLHVYCLLPASLALRNLCIRFIDAVHARLYA
jgi:FkbM family methyltransferase